MLVLFVQDYLEEGLVTAGATQAITNFLAIKHAGDLPKQFQMRIDGSFRDQQDKQQVDGLAVGSIEGDGFLEADKGTGNVLEAFGPAVRNGYTVAEAGGTQLLAGKQAVEYGTAGNVVPVFKQDADLLEYALFAAHVQIDQQMVGAGQDLGDQAHDGFGTGERHNPSF